MKKQKDARLIFRLSEELKSDLEKLGDLRDIPVSQLLRQAVKEYVEREKRHG